MLAIRLQRTGRRGHAMFRVVVQESRLSPKSGKVVARLGSYDPHAKTITVDQEKATFYLNHGAQPSSRAAYLLKNEGVKLPSWVKVSDSKSKSIRNPEKLRRNQPAEEVPTESAEEAVADAAEATPEEKPAEEAVQDEVKADQPDETAEESK